MTGDITLVALILACVSLTIGGFALRRPGVAFLGAGFWLACTVYGIVNGDPWNVTYIIGFMSIAGVIICSVDGAMVLSKKEQEQVENQEDEVDPDIKELAHDRELMYRESEMIRGRSTRKSEKRGLL
jgi:hypothetical protein